MLQSYVLWIFVSIRRLLQLIILCIGLSIPPHLKNMTSSFAKSPQNKKFVVFAEYFEQQTNCSRYRKKMSQSREVLRWGISPIYLSSSNKWKPCHGAINSRPRKLRTALEKYFLFHWNCKQLRIEARNSMVNSEIYFPIFSETIHTISKIFSQHDLRKVR